MWVLSGYFSLFSYLRWVTPPVTLKKAFKQPHTLNFWSGWALGVLILNQKPYHKLDSQASLPRSALSYSCGVTLVISSVSNALVPEENASWISGGKTPEVCSPRNNSFRSQIEGLGRESSPHQAESLRVSRPPAEHHAPCFVRRVHTHCQGTSCCWDQWKWQGSSGVFAHGWNLHCLVIGHSMGSFINVVGISITSARASLVPCFCRLASFGFWH